MERFKRIASIVYDYENNTFSDIEKRSYMPFEVFMTNMARMSKRDAKDVKDDIFKLIRTYGESAFFPKGEEELFQNMLKDKLNNLNKQWKKAKEQYIREMEEAFNMAISRWERQKDNGM